MTKYLVYYSKLLKTNWAYSANYFFSQILDLIFFLTFFFLWKGVYGNSNELIISGYTLTGLITYYFATEFIFRFDVIGAIYLNWDIWDGTLTNWLIKPLRITLLCIIDPIVEKTMSVILALPGFIASYFIARNYIDLPSLPNFGLFIITLLLSFLLNILFNLTFHALCFKHGDQDNNIELINYISWFLAGGFFPLSFVPGVLGQILQILPFKYLMFFPANVFLGKYDPREIILGWIGMLIWILIFYFIFKRVYREGLKHYTGVGR